MYDEMRCQSHCEIMIGRRVKSIRSEDYIQKMLFQTKRWYECGNADGTSCLGLEHRCPPDCYSTSVFVTGCCKVPITFGCMISPGRLIMDMEMLGLSKRRRLGRRLK